MFNLIKFAFVLFLGVISCACVNTVAVHELNQKANDYMKEGDVHSAISRLEASIDLDGDIYESRYNLAAAYMQIGECEKALKSIEVAEKLEQKEPAVYYTHGVSALCVADSMYEKKNKDGEMEKVEFSSKSDEENTAKKYIKLLTDANNAFDNYIKLSTNSDEGQELYQIMRENEEKIQEKRAQFNIEND